MTKKIVFGVTSASLMMLLGFCGVLSVQAMTADENVVSAAVYEATASVDTETATLVFDANRSDCPGQIECPLTGDLVCKDRCPLTNAAISETEITPSCCVKP